MLARVSSIAANTFREAVRDRVLYNLVFFALLMIGSAPLFSTISIGVERIVLVNLGLTSITLFGVVIAVFIGTGLVSKEIERRTLYTVLARPVRRWEFLLGKYFGLCWTLAVNAFFMAVGFFLTVLFVTRKFSPDDRQLVVALYFILLQYLVMTAIALLFSTFSSPVFAALFSFAMFAIGNFADDLRGFAGLADGATRWATMVLSYLVPNFGAMNVVSQVAHGAPVSVTLILTNSLYALVYAGAALSGAVLTFERKNLK